MLVPLHVGLFQSPIPATKALYPIRVALGQQVPGMKRLKFFSTGVHCTQLKMMLSPMTTLIVNMANQTTHFTQPLEIRSRVRANEVLLMAAARMENSPDMYNSINISENLSGAMLGGCFAHPSDIAMDVVVLESTTLT